MTRPMIEAHGVFKNYGAIEVLKDVNFDVAAGETFVIIGPNGAGKTTLFKVLTGEAFATAGTVLHEGEDITRMPAYRRVWRGFGRTFQVARTYLSFTVGENIVVAIESGQRFDPTRRGGRFAIDPEPGVIAEARQAAADVGLADKFDAPASILSHGDKKRLEIAVTLALRPKVMMMDEPTAGMSPSDRQSTVELIRQVRQRHGLTVLLTEHDMDVVFGLASRIMVLNYGKVIALGSVEEIRADPAVREVYLGEEMFVA